jgi:hypothetical protein
MKGPAAPEAVSRSVYGHRICSNIILCVVLLIIYKKTCVTLNWFIWEGLLWLLFLIIWRMLWVRAWWSIWLLLLVLFRYFFLLAYHVFLWLPVCCGNVSHFLTYNGFLKMMVDDILFRLLFNIVEGLMHPTQLLISLLRNRLLYLFPWEEFLLCDIIRLHRWVHSLLLICPRPRSDPVIISCVILMAAI